MKKKINILIIGGSGYVGSRLCEYLIRNNNFNLKNIDIKKSKFPSISKQNNYNLLSQKYLNKFKFIIILAAHSSTKKCLHDKLGAIKNNILDLEKLLQKINNSSAIPIFISTTAVYNNFKNPGKENSKILDENLLNLYDISKRYIEQYIQKKLKKYYILRLGTVSGKSPNQDKDLIINKMFFDARKKKHITSISENSKKSILFIDDFCQSLEIILKSKKCYTGIYNLNSLNMTVGQIAKYISKFYNVPILKKKGMSGYTFFSSNNKFSKVFKMKFSKKLSNILFNLDNKSL